MPNKENLIGNVYGRLTVLSEAEQLPGKRARWVCQCECGNIVTVAANLLKAGHTKSCGCLKSPDLTGKVFGKLTVLGRSDKRSPRGKRTTPMWECRCECGEITYKATDTLKNPDKSMCAACAVEYAAATARKSAGFVDGTQLSKIMNLKPSAANTSGVRGVSYDKRLKKYRVQLYSKVKRYTVDLMPTSMTLSPPEGEQRKNISALLLRNIRKESLIAKIPMKTKIKTVK